MGSLNSYMYERELGRVDNQLRSPLKNNYLIYEGGMIFFTLRRITVPQSFRKPNRIQILVSK